MYGGGHDSPVQYSCLENPMDRGAWWATVHRVAQSPAQLMWLSTHAMWCIIILLWLTFCCQYIMQAIRRGREGHKGVIYVRPLMQGKKNVRAQGQSHMTACCILSPKISKSSHCWPREKRPRVCNTTYNPYSRPSTLTNSWRTDRGKVWGHGEGPIWF